MTGKPMHFSRDSTGAVTIDAPWPNNIEIAESLLATSPNIHRTHNGVHIAVSNGEAFYVATPSHDDRIWKGTLVEARYEHIPTITPGEFEDILHQCTRRLGQDSKPRTQR